MRACRYIRSRSSAKKKRDLFASFQGFFPPFNERRLFAVGILSTFVVCLSTSCDDSLHHASSLPNPFKRLSSNISSSRAGAAPAQPEHITDFKYSWWSRLCWVSVLLEAETSGQKENQENAPIFICSWTINASIKIYGNALNDIKYVGLIHQWNEKNI